MVGLGHLLLLCEGRLLMAHFLPHAKSLQHTSRQLKLLQRYKRAASESVMEAASAMRLRVDALCSHLRFKELLLVMLNNSSIINRTVDNITLRSVDGLYVSMPHYSSCKAQTEGQEKRNPQ